MYSRLFKQVLMNIRVNCHYSQLPEKKKLCARGYCDTCMYSWRGISFKYWPVLIC